MQMTPQYLAINAVGKYSTSWNAINAQNKLGFVHPVSVSFVCIKHLMDSKRVLPMTLCA